MAPRVLVACDKFKGSLSATAACAAVARGIESALPGAVIDQCPIADGGEGFVESMVATLRGRFVSCPTVDALGRPAEASYGLVESGGDATAVLEMSAAAGLWRIAPADRDPMRSHTGGVGQMMLHAAREGKATRLVLGLGGSATNDGGAGMAAALGVRFLDAEERDLAPRPLDLARLARIDRSGLLPLPPVTVACDVTNPLLGPNGATRVFGPQKGADADALAAIEASLARLVAVAGGGQDAHRPGAGAAGGLGFGLAHFLRASLEPGFSIVARTVGLARRIAAADVVVTGEGSLDAQSLSGKAPVALARLAREAGKPVVALAGIADREALASGLFQTVATLSDLGIPTETCLRQAAPLLSRLASAIPWAALPGG